MVSFTGHQSARQHCFSSGQTNNVSKRGMGARGKKMFLRDRFCETFFSFQKANFASVTMFRRVGKRETCDETLKITNVSGTMFPGLPWAEARWRVA